MRTALIEWHKNYDEFYECPFCGAVEGEEHNSDCLYLVYPEDDLSIICEDRGYKKEKLRLNIGCGMTRYSNCIGLELEKGPQVSADVYHDIKTGLPFDDNIFKEVLFIHVVEHIHRKHHIRIFDEIHRVLKPKGRLILSYPEAIPIMKSFIENRHGARWSLYNDTIFGAQRRNGDNHVTAADKDDLYNTMFNCGFVDLKYQLNVINATITAKKGERLNEFI